MRRALFLLALALPATSLAQDRQYRKLKLTDGREIKAEVLETVATGLKMQTGQGETLISFEILMDMVPIEAAEFRAEPDARVWVYAPGYEDKLTAIYGEVKKLVVADENNLPPGVVIGLQECDADFDCMASKLEGEGWMWLVTVMPPQDDTEAALIVRGRVSGGTQIEKVPSRSDSAADLWHAAHKALGLIPKQDVTKDVLAKLGETGNPIVPDPVPDPDAGLGWTKARVHSSSWTPLPGYTALAQKDAQGFGIGLASGLVGTGAVAGILVATDMNEGEVVLYSLATYYTLSVTMNQVFGMRAYNRARANAIGLHVTPTQDGSATFGVAGRL